MGKSKAVSQEKTPITPQHKDNNNANTTKSLLPSRQQQNLITHQKDINKRQTVAVPSDLPLPTNKTSFIEWLDNSKEIKLSTQKIANNSIFSKIFKALPLPFSALTVGGLGTTFIAITILTGIGVIGMSPPVGLAIILGIVGIAAVAGMALAAASSFTAVITSVPGFIYEYHNLKKTDQLAFEASLLILIKNVCEYLPEDIDYQQLANTIKNAMRSEVIKKKLNDVLSILPPLEAEENTTAVDKSGKVKTTTDDESGKVKTTTDDKSGKAKTTADNKSKKSKTITDDKDDKEKIITSIETLINSFFNVFETAIENNEIKEAFIDSKNKVLAEENKNKHLSNFFHDIITNRQENINGEMLKKSPAMRAFLHMVNNGVFGMDNRKEQQVFKLSPQAIEAIDQGIEKYIANQNALNNDKLLT